MPALEARGVELSWSERGEGAPVLLVHETATGAAAWEPVATAVGERARAISYDRRGWGASTAPHGYERTTIEEHSEDAAALLETLGAAPAALCGAGTGAVIALDLLLRRPELVSGAVLVEPPVLSLLPEATEVLSGDRLAIEDAVRERGADGAVAAYLSGALAALGPGTGRLPDELTAGARERPARVFAELGAAPGWGMQPARFADAGRPTAIVVSQSTPPLLRAAAAALAERLGSGAPRELDSPRTPPHLGAPAGVAELVVGLSAAQR